MLTTSISLLQRVKTPTDQHAWERLVELYSPMLFRWSLLAGLDQQEATDLVQDVLLTLVRELPHFEYDPKKGRFRGWLKTITENKCREQFRKNAVSGPKIQPIDVDDCAVSDPQLEKFWDGDYDQLLLSQAMQVMKTEFEETTWKACWEFTTSGRSALEVGRDLGISEAAVYIAKSRVLKRLRLELRELLD